MLPYLYRKGNGEVCVCILPPVPLIAKVQITNDIPFTATGLTITVQYTKAHCATVLIPDRFSSLLNPFTKFNTQE